MQASDLCSSTSSDRAAATGRDCVRRPGAICVVRAFPRATGEAPSRQTPKFEASLRRPQTASPVGFVEGETLICLLASQPLRLLAVLEVGCVGESTSPADSISRPLSMWLHWPQLALLILKRAGAETVPGDPRVVKYEMKIAEGMRLRLTRNMDKEAGFTNGTKWAFVLRVDSGHKLLIYPLFHNGKPFLPCSYAYACTIRRAQGANMKLITLRFDHWHVDPGYAYVATSRATTRAGVYHVVPLWNKYFVSGRCSRSSRSGRLRGRRGGRQLQVPGVVRVGVRQKRRQRR